MKITALRIVLLLATIAGILLLTQLAKPDPIVPEGEAGHSHYTFPVLKDVIFQTGASTEIKLDNLRGNVILLALVDGKQESGELEKQILVKMKTLVTAWPDLKVSVYLLYCGTKDWTTAEARYKKLGAFDSVIPGRLDEVQQAILLRGGGVPAIVSIDAQGRLRHRLSGVPDVKVLRTLLTSTLAVTQSGEPMNDHKYTNRLAQESSPYLLQHAHNPVDWHPWGQEAFDLAKREDKPVFLSIGYSTCHWCHVMERESFENEEIAALLNENYVAIKVDREERPDVDAIYMQATLAVNRSGGWPMSVFLTPEAKPFHAGTYYPPTSAYGRMGFPDLLKQLHKAWTEEREQVMNASESLTSHLQNLSSQAGPQSTDLTAEVLQRAYNLYVSRFDSHYGGFGDKPKFPSPHNMQFLLRYWSRGGEDKALEMVEKTLQEMARGGIYDHLGGGFARYSTDERWLLPHFEKMLYDQSQMARTIAEAYQITHKPVYADQLRGILDYVLRDMTDESGGFYSAEDADSEGVEGKFYVWTIKEVTALLGEKDAVVFASYYNMSKKGNFSHEAGGHGGPTGDNILHIALGQTDDMIAEDHKITVDELQLILKRSKKTLWEVREKRVHPFKDDKILSEWNGMMIGALAKAGQALQEPAYTAAAVRAGEFLVSTMMPETNRLLRRYRKGHADIAGYLDDYAYVSEGFIELYEATQDPRWLQHASELADAMVAMFWDEKLQGFRFSGENNETLIAQSRELYDGAYPSGNAAAVNVLTRLAHYTDNASYRDKVDSYFKAASGTLVQMPTGYAYSLIALAQRIDGGQELVIVGDPSDASVQAMLRMVQQQFMPNKALVLRPDGDAGKGIIKLVPYVAEQSTVDGKATFYLCENFTCDLPRTDLKEVEKALQQRARQIQSEDK